MDTSGELLKPSSPELTKPQRIEYISGDHTETQEEANTLRDKTLKGDLSNHGWSKNTAEITRQVAPRILAIDGLSPSRGRLVNKSDFSQKEKQDIWVHGLPARPRDINPQGVVIIIAGDILYRSMPFGETLNAADARKLQEVLDAKDDKALKDPETAKKIEKLALVFPPMLVAVLASVASTQEHHQEKKGLISRRTFLRGAALASGSVAVLGIANTIAYLSSAKAPNTTVSQIDQKILDLGRRFSVTKDNYLNGRTALLIAKAEEAASLGLTPPDSKAALLMGSAHTPEAQHLLHDKNARKQAIHDYAAEYVGAIRELRTLFPGIPEDEAIHQMLDIFAQADIGEVTDPGTDFSKDPTDLISTYVSYVGHLDSREVLEAVKDLRPKSDQKYTDKPLVF